MLLKAGGSQTWAMPLPEMMVLCGAQTGNDNSFFFYFLVLVCYHLLELFSLQVLSSHIDKMMMTRKHSTSDLVLSLMLPFTYTCKP